MRDRTPEQFTAATQIIRSSDLPEQQRLMLEAQLRFAAGDSPAAWDLLKIHLNDSTFSLPENALTISNIALEAGDARSAQQWLCTALSGGLDALEHLLCARLVACRLGLSPEEQQIDDRIVQLFPEHQAALQIQYDRHFLKQEFSQAATIAEKLSDQFQLRLCNTFKEAEIDCNRPAAPCGLRDRDAKLIWSSEPGELQPLGQCAGVFGAKVSFQPLGVSCQMSLLGWLGSRSRMSWR